MRYIFTSPNGEKIDIRGEIQTNGNILIRKTYRPEGRKEREYSPHVMRPINFLTYLNELQELADTMKGKLSKSEEAHYEFEDAHEVDIEFSIWNGEPMITMSEPDEWCDSCRKGDRKHFEIMLPMQQLLKLKKAIDASLEGYDDLQV